VANRARPVASAKPKSMLAVISCGPFRVCPIPHSLFAKTHRTHAPPRTHGTRTRTHGTPWRG
jgi:hypothetical protein